MQGQVHSGKTCSPVDAAKGVNFAAYDGNGNVMALIEGSDGTVSANYEYGPVGEATRITGTMANAKPTRHL